MSILVTALHDCIPGTESDSVSLEPRTEPIPAATTVTTSSVNDKKSHIKLYQENSMCSESRNDPSTCAVNLGMTPLHVQ